MSVLQTKKPVGQRRVEAAQVGLEPTTLRLTAECSAIELLSNILSVANVIGKSQKVKFFL